MESEQFFENLQKLRESVASGDDLPDIRRQLTEYLIATYAEKIGTLFYKNLADKQLCEDLVQDLYLAIFLYLHQVREQNQYSLVAWISTIARNILARAINEQARRKKLGVVALDEARPVVACAPKNSPAINYMAREIIARIEQAIADGRIKFKPIDHEIWQWWCEGWKPKEILAKINGNKPADHKISYNNLRVRLHRILKKITDFIEEEC